jgi:hypothetical protein
MRPILVEGQDYVKDGEMCRYAGPVPEEMTPREMHRFVFSHGTHAKTAEFLDGLEYAPYVVIDGLRFEVGWRGRIVNYLTGPNAREGANELLERGCVEQLLVLREGSGRYEVAHLVENTPCSSADGYRYELDSEDDVISPMDVARQFSPERHGSHVSPDKMVELVKSALAAAGLPCAASKGEFLAVQVEIEPGSGDDPTVVVLEGHVEIVPVWNSQVVRQDGRGARIVESPVYRIDKWHVTREGDYGGGLPQESREEGGDVYPSPYNAAQEAVVEVVRDRVSAHMETVAEVDMLAELDTEQRAQHDREMRTVGFEESETLEEMSPEDYAASDRAYDEARERGKL